MINFLRKLADERYFAHRQRSTSLAGVTGGIFAAGLFAYRYYVNHVWSWDLLAVALTFAGIKIAAMTYYYLTD